LYHTLSSTGGKPGPQKHRLDAEILDLSRRLAPPQTELDNKKAVLAFLQQLVKKQWPDVCLSL
jgi:DNA polymerase sigma